MPQTLEEIRREGLAALRERLGRAGMIRFLQQFEITRGDYSRLRHEWVDQTSLAELGAKPRTKKPQGKTAKRSKS